MVDLRTRGESGAGSRRWIRRTTHPSTVPYYLPTSPNFIPYAFTSNWTTAVCNPVRVRPGGRSILSALCLHVELWRFTITRYSRGFVKLFSTVLIYSWIWQRNPRRRETFFNAWNIYRFARNLEVRKRVRLTVK